MKTARQAAGDYFDVQCPSGFTVQDQLAGIIEARDAEWRRLVEEAQAETRRVSNEEQFRLLAVGAAAEEARTERDRLKGELSMERNAYDKTLYRLKGELAEARNDLEYYRRNFPGHCIPRPVAATPAEQARVSCEDGKDECAFECQQYGQKHAAEQAQGEATNFWAGPICTKTHAIGAACDCDPIAALAKRLDGLTARLDRIASPPSRPFVSEVKRHWDDPAVRDNFVDATLDDHEARLRGLEWRFKTEGEKP
jgi:hypothetical protein